MMITINIIDLGDIHIYDFKIYVYDNSLNRWKNINVSKWNVSLLLLKIN